MPVGKKTLTDYSELSKQRSNIYKFLSLIYAQEPDEKLVEKILEPEILIALSEVGIKLSDEVILESKEKLLEDLIVEYTRLFLGPGHHISPHESVYIGGYKDRDPQIGLLWGNATVEVKDLIEELGYIYQDEYNGIPDHLAVELELMSNLTAKEHDVIINDNLNEGYNYLSKEKQFLNEHLARWIEPFCELVVENAEHSFYREMAFLTKDFVLNDISLIDQCISEIKGELDVRN